MTMTKELNAVSETSVAVKVEEISPVKKKLFFEVNWDDVRKETDAVFREVGKTAAIKGFRKGKVPRAILERYYQEHVEGETITNLINRHYWEALKTHDILAVSQPEIEQSGIEKDKNFTFAVTVETFPVIEPKGYAGLELEKVEYDVTEKDIEVRLEQYRQMFATMEEVKEARGVKEGDFITLNFSGAIDGVRKKELEAENFFLEVGIKRFIPGFEEQLIGVKIDETQEISVHFPEDYYIQDIAGKNAVFTLTVKSIKEKKLPLLDASFIDNFEKFRSLDDLKEDIRKTLAEQNKTKSEGDFRNLIVTELLKNNEFEMPPSYVEREYQYMKANALRRMSQDGLGKEEAEEIGLRFQDQYRLNAIRVVKVAALFESIARQESINIEESELDEKINEISRQTRDFEKTKKYLENENIKTNLRQEILHDKIFKFIEDNATITVINKEPVKEAESK
jgi:trigger factor